MGGVRRSGGCQPESGLPDTAPDSTRGPAASGVSGPAASIHWGFFARDYERGSTLNTSNLPFDEWTEVFGSERLTGALLDRLTHHVNILEMNGDSYRLSQSRSRAAKADT